MSAVPAVESIAVPGRSGRSSAFSGAWLLSGAMLLSGVLIYVFHVLAARALGADAYGIIAVLWAALFLVVIVVFRPLEQTTSRSVAHRLARGEEAASVVRSVGLISLALLALIAALGAGGWNLISERLFGGDDVVTGALLAGIAAYGASYVVRGLLAGTGWFAGYGACLIGDSIARLAIAAPLVVIASKHVAAAAIAGAGLAGAAVPLYVGRRRIASYLSGVPAARFPLRGALGFAAPASVIAAADQLLVNGGPLLVMLAGGPEASRAAGVIFAATMLVRVPVFLFQGLATSLLPNLTRLQVADRAAFRWAVGRAVGVLFGFGVVIVAAAAAAGPEAMRLVYGDSFIAGRQELVLLGAGVACYLGASTCSQALLALDRTRAAAAGWLISAALFLSLFESLDAPDLTRVAVAFAGASASALVVLSGALASSRATRLPRRVGSDPA